MHQNLLLQGVVDFDAEREREEEARRTGADKTFSRDEHEALIEAARKEAREEGYSEGYAKGEEDMRASILQDCAKSLQVMIPQIEGFLEKTFEHQAQLEDQVTRFAEAILQRILPEVVAHYSVDRVRNEVRRVLSMAMMKPGLKVYLSTNVAEQLTEEFADLARDMERPDGIVAVPDETLNDGDLKVVWDNGFLEYSYEDVCNHILDCVRGPQAGDQLNSETEGNYG